MCNLLLCPHLRTFYSTRRPRQLRAVRMYELDDINVMRMNEASRQLGDYFGIAIVNKVMDSKFLCIICILSGCST